MYCGNRCSGLFDEVRMSVSEVERQCTPRLADYFVELQLDEAQIRHGSSVGIVTRRLPTIEWPDVPFPNSISMDVQKKPLKKSVWALLKLFCVPNGWSLAHKQLDPTFFVCTLTDLMGAHQYACCLQVYEPCLGGSDEDCEDLYHPSSSTFRPRVYVILSRYPYFDLFRACLHRIFLAIQNDVLMAEVMIATIISKILLIGRTPISFTMGGERVSVQPILQRRVPLTGDRVARFARCLVRLCHQDYLTYTPVFQIYLRNSIAGTVAGVSGKSYTLSHGRIIPSARKSMMEFLAKLECFVMVLNFQLPNVDAVVVDLDTGEVRLPVNSQLAELPSPFRERLITRLQRVLSPELSTADYAIPAALPPPLEPHLLDKEIRACFVLFFSELLYGYRSCLELVRLHRHPLIVFHKAAFMGMRHLSSPLLHDLIEGQMFQLFVATRGLPFRECDIFDEIVCTATIDGDDLDTSDEKQRLSRISSSLLMNEKQECIMTTTPTLTKRTSLALTNGDHFNHDECTIRPLSNDRINALIEQNRSHWSLDDPGRLHPKEVPVPEKLNLYEEHIGANSRRLLVLSACVDAIFDNRMSEARKMMCAVELSLRVVAARVALCRQAMLQPAQFELVVRLLNCALEHESDDDEHGIAYACLHLGNMYCRRLSQGVQQYAYTCVQDHSVWSNQRFWETAFFHDVHELMRRHYGKVHDSGMPLSGKSPYDMWNLLEEPTAMAVSAVRLSNLTEYSEEELKKCSEEEESIVYGQAKHYVNLMIYLRVPLDASRLRRIDKNDLELRGNSRGLRDVSVSSFTTIMKARYICLHHHVVTWISRVIDRICSAAGLDPRLTEQLTQVIPGFVAVHIDNLEQVYAESRKLAPPPKVVYSQNNLVKDNTNCFFKPKLLTPVLLTPCERIIVGGLRCVLLPEGRPANAENPENNVSLLPAEGALFLTNYRIIFKGRPTNPFLTDTVVVRSVPIMTLTKEKSIGDQSLQAAGQLHGISSKVTGDEVEAFTKSLSSQRWPSILPHTLFAYNTVSHLLTSTLPTGPKSKYSTIRELKKTIARFPGKINKWPSPLATPALRSSTQPNKTDTFANHSDYLDLSDIPEIINPLNSPEIHRHHLHDYERLRFRGIDSIFRVSYTNAHYDVIKTYPCAFVVPSSVGDDAFLKIAKGFKHGRFPVITWTSENGALLIRGSGLTQSNVVQKFKKANILHGSESVSTLGGSRMTLVSKDSGDAGPLHSVEYQEHYLARLAQVSPSGSGDLGGTTGSLASLLSVDSLLTADGMSSVATGTPDARRRNQGSDLARHYATSIRSSGGKPGSRGCLVGVLYLIQTIGLDLGSMMNPNIPWTIASSYGERQSQKTLQFAIGSLTRKNLYILIFRGDKNVEFVPISFPTTHQMKVSFKKLLRVMRPSIPFMDSSSSTFYRSLEESEWLQMISNLLSLSTSIASIVNMQNSSVALCIEEGWDATCQLMSLAELMLDPFYRTIEGFQILIEKEWLAFGHRFSHRANHTISSQNSGITPVFLVFLDAVHQLLEQFPGAFEINDFYLRFLAYHSQSAFFRTFLLDCESERVHLEQLVPETGEGHRGCVLLPACSVAALRIWTFYSEETLSHGSPYDIDLAEAELAERDDEHFAHSGEGDEKEEKRDWDWQVRRVLMKRAAVRVLLRGMTSRAAANQKKVVPEFAYVVRERIKFYSGRQSGQRCRQCGVIAHDKCIVNITWPCDSRVTTVPRTVQEQSLPPTPSKSIAEPQSTVVRSETMLSDIEGAKFKLWAPRWFELEANSHKMYYYESEHDMECRGYIDLCDVGSVEVENNGSKAILELRTKKRAYSLLAESRLVAETWKEKIEMVLRE
ncbi:unnamed protein product [Strongylus vulgaris]|uniref:Myotubularin phosphatase domain-containing protein n=1 Tax=Strongylus vulgaris TaxID=40348 RepID=A0A3P7KX03_STRVU|nr:unnamed protein product [Strongylus vulgaris]